ncbi:MAG: tripartite tricarboxylate transporter substrate binding protein [Clostridiales bacterium]|nr:tripartite tricarboxylate transporter substrate binding protein [Clostridiales bacterium]
MKKILSLVLALCLLSVPFMALAEWEWENDIEITCTFDTGSGTDTTLRAIMPQVAKYLGVNIIINNVSGASGVNGALHFAKQPADGYNYAMYTPSHAIAAQKQINGELDLPFDMLNDTEPVIRLVQDSNVIFANTALPFSDVEGMIAYAKEHPGELTLSLQSITGIDAVSAQDFFDKAGIDVTIVAADGSEAYAMVIGGHASMTLGSPADGAEYYAAGMLNALVVLSENRSTAMPDVPCSVELGYDATIGPWRGMVAMKGTPEEAMDAFCEAVAHVMATDTAWQEWVAANGLADREGYAERDDFKVIWTDYNKAIGELLYGAE